MITGHEVLGMMNNYFGTMWPGMSSGGWSFVLLFWVFLLAVFIGVWIYTSLAYMEIARKLKYKNSWLAWIPFARGAMILQLGGFNWALIFLLLIPIAGWVAFAVLFYISSWRIFEKRKYSGWLALVPLIGFAPYFSIFAEITYFVILGFVAWQDKKGRR